MTRLEKMIVVCTKDCDLQLDYDPTEGHYHCDPWPPEFLDATFSDDPVTMHVGGDFEFSIDDLKELRDWLNIVLAEDQNSQEKAAS